jgi:dephospho-CoA kinase
MNPNRVPLIGVAGGIASGKSFVAEQLSRKGAAVVSADRLAHEVLRQDDVKQRARERWGDAIFSADGEVNRTALGKIVFAPPPAGPPELAYLEQLTHPKVGELARERIRRLQEQQTDVAIVLDVPLLFESGWNKFCDKIIFVDAPREVRLERALARGWTREDFARREAAQESLQTKRDQADMIIDSFESAQAVQAQIEHSWHSLIDHSRAH